MPPCLSNPPKSPCAGVRQGGAAERRNYGTPFFFAILFALLSTTPAAGEPWSKEDIAWQVGVEALFLADYLTTREALSRPNMREVNTWAFGENPSQTRVDLTFIGLAVIHPLALHFVKPPWRRRLQVLMVGSRGAVVMWNLSNL